MGCLAASIYIYKIDVLKQVTVSDPDTRETIRTWEPFKTVKAYVFPYIAGGLRGMGAHEVFEDRYSNSDFVRVKTQHELDKRWRITNIRLAKNGKVIFQENIDGPPTIYNVDGSAPIVNHLGGGIVDEWLTTLSRAEVQING